MQFVAEHSSASTSMHCFFAACGKQASICYTGLWWYVDGRKLCTHLGLLNLGLGGGTDAGLDATDGRHSVPGAVLTGHDWEERHQSCIFLLHHSCAFCLQRTHAG